VTLIPHVDEARLVTLVNDPGATNRRWIDRAACGGISLAGYPYFPDDGEFPPTEALIRCMTCPVVHECLATALIDESKDGFRFGWWGGSSPDERDILAQRIGLVTQEVESDARQPAELARILRERKYTVPSIAAELGCTERTVYRYLANTAA
jgi:hypothetical protein